jgi:hypothetical protein
MKELPRDYEFDQGQYERPNQDWICGKMAEGKPCRTGPNLRGRCRAAGECRPLLENGSYVCARTTALGKKWPCENGPLTDGCCSRPITKCVPVRTLLARRRVFTIFTVVFTGGLLLAGLCGPFRERFISPGKLSAPHATERFAKLAGKADAGEKNCAACHQTAQAGLSRLLSSAFTANPGPLQVRSLGALEPPSATALDQKCEHCHLGHSFHQADTVRKHSCSACHIEHRGPSPMGAPRDANCLSCHANNQIIEASALLGQTLPAAAFDYQFGPGANLFKIPHPKSGYTKPIHSFSTDHPEFQLVREKLADPNTLKFSHKTHLDPATVLARNGVKLDCQDCHEPDASGAYYRKMSYEQNCKDCHRLQFDPHNPDLLIPHGDAEHVRAFLRSLPAQYEDYNAKHRIRSRDSRALVHEQVTKILVAYGSIKALEQRVFLSNARYAPTAKIAGLSGQGASTFPGCAKCHEVREGSSEGDIPLVSKPFIPERWLTRGKFDHGKHLNLACDKCHNAEHSHMTSDILLPAKAVCANCHSSQGGVANNCSTCHNYHLSHKETLVAR